MMGWGGGDGGWLPTTSDPSADAGEEEGFGALIQQQQEAFGPTATPMGPMGPCLTPPDVLAWLDYQAPYILRQIIFHSRWLLEQYGCDPDKPGENEGEEEVEGKLDSAPESTSESTSPDGAKEKNQNQPMASIKPLMAAGVKSKANKKSNHPGFGWTKSSAANQQLQWTPTGWITKDNAHKVPTAFFALTTDALIHLIFFQVTTTSRPLPDPDIIPPMSTTYPEASADRDKLKVTSFNSISVE
jgi:hypothetical protein